MVQQSDSVVKLTTVVQQLALGLWLLYDHVILAASLGFVQPNDTVKRRANICWLVAMVAGKFLLAVCGCVTCGVLCAHA
jgi:hypothetical protein